VEETISGRANSIKEYAIGVEVYGRPVGYDPKIDAIVRVEAGRLRGKLENYYRTEGAANELRLELPKGRYVPIVTPAPLTPTVSSERHWFRGWAVAVPALILAVLLFAIWAGRRPKPGLPILSVAVLPLTHGPDDTVAAQSAAAIGDDLANAIAVEGAFSVINRTHADGGAVRRVPGAQAVIEGNVQTTPSGQRIYVRLISMQTGRDMWSQTYESLPGMQTHFQNRVANLVARTLRARFGGLSEDQLNKPPSFNSQAMALYVKGHEAWLLQDEAGLLKSLEVYRQAIGQDAQFAKAYEGMAASELFLASFDIAEAANHYARAKSAALRAIELDDRLADAHARLGNIYLRREWNFAAAENELRRSVVLEPGSQPITRWYSEAARLRENNTLARQELENALFAHPNGEMIHTELGMLDYQMGRNAEAAKDVRTALAIKPAFRLAHLLAGLLHEQQREVTEAEAEYKSCSNASEFGRLCMAALGHCYARHGAKGAGLKIASELAEIAPPAPTLEALVYVAAGDRERAFAALDRAYKMRDQWLPLIKLDKRFSPLHGDARYDALMDRLGLRVPAQ
jgi:serine/threonine-protein kinase